MKNYFLIFNQFLITLFVLLICIFRKVQLLWDFDELPKKKYVFVANHYSKLDPFLIATLFNIRFRYWPYRFLTSEEYMKDFPMRVFLYWCGCFSISKLRNKGKKPLEKAKEFLDNGETIFIFPEGRLNKTGNRDKNISLGIGPIYLENLDKEVYLIPVKISYFGREIKIHYKKPFRHKGIGKDFKPLIESTMDYIYE